MAGYIRQEVYADTDVIEATDTNNEFDQLVAAFNSSTGHKHDGTAAEGPLIGLISDATQTDKVEIVTGGAKTTGTHQTTGLITADVGITATTGNITATAGDVVLTAGDVTLAALATVDGRDVSVDGTKLDTIETSATADQTNAEIKTAYEANADTNEFSDAEQTKLAGIETAATADQTGAQIKTAYEAELSAFTDAQFTKLAGIETAATADQTNAEIKTAYEANANTNEFSDAEQTKLSGIETGATKEVAATTTTAGISELATSAETITGTDTGRTVTPAGLQAKVASSTARGIVELATNAEAQAGTDATRAVTPASMAAVTATETRKGLVERASQAEVDAGTDNARFVSPATLAAATTTGVFTAAFTSAEQTITSAGALTLAHSLGAEPTLIQLRLINKTAEFNYSIGDEVLVNPASNVNGSAVNRGISIVPDSTNINIRYGSSSTTFTATDKTTGVGQTLTNANWNLIVKAWV